MTTQITSAPAPPADETSITSASGQLAVKAGGITGAMLATGNGNVGDSQWILLDTESPAASTTLTTAALTAYTHYLIEYDLKFTVATDLFALRLNGLTGSVYRYKKIAAAAVSTVTDTLFELIEQTMQVQQYKGVVYVGGISPAVASGQVGIGVQGDSGIGNTDIQILGGFCILGNNAQVSTMTFLRSGTGTFTGTIKIYGKN